MVNPFICYAFSFAVALLTYLLGWSDLYPRLSLPLLSFILITIIIHVFLGVRFTGKKIVTFKKIQTDHHTASLWITLFLYTLWGLEFLYEGGVPLIKILLNQPYHYKLFGIPSLHVFIVTFSSFYTVYLFHLYLSSRKKMVLFLYFINLFAAILIYSRAMFFFNLSASFFLFLFTVHKIPRHFIYTLPLALVILFYFFGVLGTLRVSLESKKAYDNTLFMQIGKANDSFSRSVIPKEYFWAYIYMSSPLANLQHNINTYPATPTIARLGEMINNEILMDFISKRVNTALHLKRRNENTIPGPFNVSTVYSRSFSYLGWTGIALMAIVILFVPWLYLKLVPQNSPFFLTGFVILCTMFLFLAYDNTLRFTGLCFQLVYPVVLNFAIPRSGLLRKVFT